LKRVEGWARDGLTDEQIAHNMGISYSSFKDWKNKYPTFLAILKRGKEVVDREVENALLKSAQGFEYEEVTEELRWDKSKNDYVMKVVKRVKKIVPPSTVAQIFWLKNRKPTEWRDKREVEANNESLEKLDEFLEKIGGVE
jgi:hypothetical protein